MSERTFPSWSQDIKVVSLISLAHGCSHFFQLVLPPLFPLLVREFDVGYTELGLVMTVFFVVSGFAQVASGFLVDRFGARRVLMGGLGLYASVIAMFAMAPAFWLFFPAAVLLGLGNSVFHPADFTIMNARVTPSRLGRAFGMHTLGGNLGWAVAPVFMLSLTLAFNWRIALGAAAAVGFSVLIALWLGRDDLEETTRGRAAGRAGGRMSLLPMISRSVVYCFIYFALLALALIAIQNFLPPILNTLYGTPLEIGNIALTGFLLGAAAGVLVGGFLADRNDRYSLLIAGGLTGAAVAIALVGNFALPVFVMVLLVSSAGFLSGLTTPSRDLLVRSATPAGATGRVFGFVYSGLDVGSALAPISIGILLDGGQVQWVLWLVSAILLLAIATVLAVRPAN